MEYTLDELLDITEDYLNKLDFTSYFDFSSKNEIKVQDIIDDLNDKMNKGQLPPLPEALEGNLFKAFDIWDFTYYLKKVYHLNYREEVTYTLLALK